MRLHKNILESDFINHKTPIYKIEDTLIKDSGIKLFIKREDLNHPELSGNKWHKLKYNLIAAKEKGYGSLLTFGGAYSNHIYATAAAGKLFGIQNHRYYTRRRTSSTKSNFEFCRFGGNENPLC